MLSGYKTYILGGVAIITAIAGYLVGVLPLNSAVTDVIGALMGMTIRHSIAVK